MPEPVLPVRRALVSVSDKAGLCEHARALSARGVELISTGGTRAALEAEGLAVADVSAVTGFPEMLGGRVKTLHPKIHGGLLARRERKEDLAALAEHDIPEIDLVYVNLYPFEATLAGGGCLEELIETIDIGGVALLRAAAKTYAHVAVCGAPEDLAAVIADLDALGGVSLALRRRLAAQAFARTAAYDAAISNWLLGEAGVEIPPWRALGGALAQPLRYGENPHQWGAVYRMDARRPGPLNARVVQGKALSYNNIADADAAYELIAEFDPARGPAVAIIKHANPCGVARGDTIEAAYRRALACDPVSAFGGIIAANAPLDAEAAAAITEIFTEVIIAPGASEEAIAIFAKKKNLRLLLADGLPDPAASGLVARTVSGGLLVQARDNARLSATDLTIVTRRKPSPAEVEDMLMAFAIARHVRSNAVVYVKDGAAAGVGAGQMNRRDSARIAAARAREAAKLAGWDQPMTIGSACASDAFFPFADGLLEAVEAGAACVIAPSGSIRDDEVIAAADQAGITLAFTPVRGFRH